MQHLNGHAFASLPVDPQDGASSAGAGPSSSSSSSSSFGDRGSGYPNSGSSSPGGYMNRQWAAGEPGSSQQQAGSWQQPRYRRSGLRLRSKRVLQAAEKLQRSGSNLVAEELQQFVASTSGSSRQQEPDAAEDRDEHLESFIERMLCAKTNVWKQSEQQGPATADGREAIDPEVLANIHTMPADQIWEQQTQLASRGQLQAALLLLEEATAAGRRDVLQNTNHKVFLRAAGAWYTLCLTQGEGRACVTGMQED
jgi:hypothetical protein